MRTNRKHWWTIAYRDVDPRPSHVAPDPDLDAYPGCGQQGIALELYSSRRAASQARAAIQTRREETRATKIVRVRVVVEY